MKDMILKAAVKAQILKNDVKGATAIEYGLIAAGIAVAIITVVFTLGNDLENMFTGVSNQISAKTPQ